ncbi:MAG: hypothetical protein AAB011_03835, partial [Candidatus Eisenbacteria bacterium]
MLIRSHSSWSRPRRFAAALLAAVAAAVLWAGAASRSVAADQATAPVPASTGNATGHASVHLVRFLDEVSETDRARFGPLHDIRLRLEPGFVVLVRREGDFAAILPIETREGSPDSLQYFWYLERGPLLWIIPRGRDRGVRTVADAGDIRFDSFTLRWGKGGDRGWLYFPDLPENRGVRVSVVSG